MTIQRRVYPKNATAKVPAGDKSQLLRFDEFTEKEGTLILPQGTQITGNMMYIAVKVSADSNEHGTNLPKFALKVSDNQEWELPQECGAESTLITDDDEYIGMVYMQDPRGTNVFPFTIRVIDPNEDREWYLRLYNEKNTELSLVFIVTNSAKNIDYLNSLPKIDNKPFGEVRAGKTIWIDGTAFDVGECIVKIADNLVDTINVTPLQIELNVPGSELFYGEKDLVVKNFNDSDSTKITILPTPELAVVKPTEGPVGEPVTLTGEYFNSGDLTVDFGGQTVQWTGDPESGEITVKVPEKLVGPVSIKVKTKGGTSNSLSFEVLPTPVLTAVKPTEGPVGEDVTLTGKYFNTGDLKVDFGGKEVQWTGDPESGEITAKVPEKLEGPVQIVVETKGGKSKPQPFEVLPTPVLAVVKPTEGPVGEDVTLTGKYFNTGDLKVDFGGKEVQWTGDPESGEITVKVPEKLIGPVSIKVKTKGGTSNSLSFEVLPILSVERFHPTKSAHGVGIQPFVIYGGFSKHEERIDGINFVANIGEKTFVRADQVNAHEIWACVPDTLPTASYAVEIVDVERNVIGTAGEKYEVRPWTVPALKPPGDSPPSKEFETDWTFLGGTVSLMGENLNCGKALVTLIPPSACLLDTYDVGICYDKKPLGYPWKCEPFEDTPLENREWVFRTEWVDLTCILNWVDPPKLSGEQISETETIQDYDSITFTVPSKPTVIGIWDTYVDCGVQVLITDNKGQQHCLRCHEVLRILKDYPWVIVAGDYFDYVGPFSVDPDSFPNLPVWDGD